MNKYKYTKIPKKSASIIKYILLCTLSFFPLSGYILLRQNLELNGFYMSNSNMLPFIILSILFILMYIVLFEKGYNGTLIIPTVLLVLISIGLIINFRLGLDLYDPDPAYVLIDSADVMAIQLKSNPFTNQTISYFISVILIIASVLAPHRHSDSSFLNY